MKETDLYAPVKAFLEKQGYEVKAEITDCDLVAIRGTDPPVIVELKLSLSLDLLMQGIARQRITDAVYIAVPAGKGKAWSARAKDAVKICKRLGLGLISVRFDSEQGLIIVHTDPGAHKIHKLAKRKSALLLEFQRRVGDPNTGGQSRRAIITAYRQDALRIAVALQAGPRAPSDLAKSLAIPKTPSILQKNHYGWFIRIERGVYSIGPDGQAALKTYSDIVEALTARSYK
ncbi:MAG: hypothetical protein COA53_06775 [Rhodobacteraceae bacterium]|nr:MAG: hypothetical protein COA53_06775 [Paracoccaceae bacterium]